LKSLCSSDETYICLMFVIKLMSLQKGAFHLFTEDSKDHSIVI
jgi:hypothetical protein